MSETVKKTKNKVNIYAYRNEACHSFFISMFLRAGSMFETEREAGITHFLEHIAIRNVNAVMDGGLYPLLDKHGIEFNASTFAEMVQFYVSGAPKNFSVASSVVSSVMSPIVLSVSEISVERDRIKAEIREGDEKNSLASFTNTIVFEGTSLSRSIIGTNKSVSRITKTALESYRRAVMTPENIFFYVTGNFTDSDLDTLAREIEKYDLGGGFGIALEEDENSKKLSEADTASTVKIRENKAPLPESYFNRTGDVYIKNGDFTMLRLTFDVDMKKASAEALDLIYDILIGGYNSRLFMEMSERRGIFYDISGNLDKYNNIGSFAFSFEVKEGKIYEALELSLLILSEAKDKILSESECMKAGYTDNAHMLLDDVRELNFTFAYNNHILNRNFKNIEDQKNAYSSVTPEDIRDVMRSVFRKENLTVTVKGKKRKIDTVRLQAIVEKFK